MNRYVGGAVAAVFAGAAVTTIAVFLEGPGVVILVGALISAGGALWASIEKVRFERDLRATVTGGDSFCYLELMFPAQGGESGGAIVAHQGEHPLYDVTIRIVDLDKFELIKDELSLRTLSRIEHNLNVGTVIPHHAATLLALEVPQNKDIRWNVFISARNGSFIQRLRLLRVDGRWTSAIRVIREDVGKDTVLMEQVNSDFPRDVEGNVRW